MTDLVELAARAAAAVRSADALMICAGAGMGVDSGLPDFRGPEGFWRAYPAARRLGLQFHDLADPRWFFSDPPLAWGFYGHRLNLYRATAPHAGFALLQRWAARTPAGAFVFTSNVDGQFQRAGVPEARVEECHGSILHLQCLNGCDLPPWSAAETAVSVDVETLRAAQPLPACPRCGKLARPNILMFGDFAWDSSRANEQRDRLAAWLQELEQRRARVVVFCLGAGTAIPSVRLHAERTARRLGGTLIRINPRDSWVPDGQICLPTGALAGLAAIDAALAQA
ncbi:NAD-dependent protein deacetylase, SIR2 family [Nannocystis exedens]|uniref:protein acetyllysine N-acetyltransferase n=1 Tax=Nannocystis exedens TaxID=54 RepID=A0A1I2FED5_9BACT|nr:Sir2 family NAD-dependent protein deacetylase [Nannocystis exedens]PCC70526.1 NAD-dependent protein deacetylase [Nannocystis exedens]SFF02861.1 NAD-dependent protein deacetylase, SIR2 family [Nannocystis exedens]